MPPPSAQHDPLNKTTRPHLVDSIAALCWYSIINAHSHPKPAALPGTNRLLWVLWITYGSFYFCRNNLAIALPGMEAELGYTKAQLGTVLMALKLTYGAGQFLNGQLAERVAPRKLLAIGLLASAGLNVLFGWMTSLYFLTFVWACNGYVQALGWTPTMRVAANWFDPVHRGRAIGIIATGYQLCATLTFFVAGWATEVLGWRGALYIPAILLVASAAHMLFFLKERPQATNQDGMPKEETQARGTLRDNLALTLTNPGLWLLAMALALLDACRYGFSDWGVSHLKEVQRVSVSSAAFKYAVLPLGGIIGTYVSGWLTDRFFNGRRAPVVCSLLVFLAVLALVYNSIIQMGFVASVVILFLLGFCIYGPQVLLVGTFPVDLARRGTAAAATGFVNAAGYIGAAAGDKLTGYLAHQYGWQRAIWFWASCALGAAVIVAGLWNKGGTTHVHGPRTVPRSQQPRLDKGPPDSQRTPCMLTGGALAGL